MTQYSSEFLLQLLQRFIKHRNQVNQIHSILTTKGSLLYNPNSPPISKWKSTLFYNALIRAYQNFNQNNISLYLFTLMLAHKTPPNGHTFPPLIKAATLSSPSTGAALHAHVVKCGLFCDAFVQISLVSFYSQLGSLFDAHKVFVEIGFPCIVEYNAMIDACAKNGDMGSAFSLFKGMVERDIVTWTSVINGFLVNGLFDEAIEVFREMMVCDDVNCGLVKPNEATFVSVISCCANLERGGAVYLGKQIHGYVIRKEVVLSVFMGTAMIDLYGKVGCLSNAIIVFNQMVFKEVCTWNALISSLANNGRENDAVDMFEKMKQDGLWPNEVTFVAVLTACARAKLVELGLKLFRLMTSEFRVEPLMEHYGCVVDLLGRAGLLREASEVIQCMPFEPDASVLGALLGACKIYGATEMGNEVGRKLLGLQPHHCGPYMVLSNINASVEKWGTASNVRKAMVAAGIRKVPAYSLLIPCKSPL